jgi:DNA-directed RNA polymerase specialized sigma24 family protein
VAPRSLVGERMFGAGPHSRGRERPSNRERCGHIGYLAEVHEKAWTVSATGWVCGACSLPPPPAPLDIAYDAHVRYTEARGAVIEMLAPLRQKRQEAIRAALSAGNSPQELAQRLALTESQVHELAARRRPENAY